MKGKKVLFIDRDGTLIREAPPEYMINSIEKLHFYPHVFHYMRKIATEFSFELVMVTNQDGLGTDVFPVDKFWPLHNLIMRSFESESVRFEKTFIDKSFPHQNLPTRKPGIGMLTEYLNNPAYDIASSYVIGDRVTDVQMARNLGCKAIWLKNNASLGSAELTDTLELLEKENVAIATPHWKDVYDFLNEIEHKKTDI